jgi:hypothetical protein
MPFQLACISSDGIRSYLSDLYFYSQTGLVFTKRLTNLLQSFFADSNNVIHKTSYNKLTVIVLRLVDLNVKKNHLKSQDHLL